MEPPDACSRTIQTYGQAAARQCALRRAAGGARVERAHLCAQAAPGDRARQGRARDRRRRPRVLRLPELCRRAGTRSQPPAGLGRGAPGDRRRHRLADAGYRHAGQGRLHAGAARDLADVVRGPSPHPVLQPLGQRCDRSRAQAHQDRHRSQQRAGLCRRLPRRDAGRAGADGQRRREAGARPVARRAIPALSVRLPLPVRSRRRADGAPVGRGAAHDAGRCRVGRAAGRRGAGTGARRGRRHRGAGRLDARGAIDPVGCGGADGGR